MQCPKCNFNCSGELAVCPQCQHDFSIEREPKALNADQTPEANLDSKSEQQQTSLKSCPKVSPEVMDFNESDLDFESCLDEMIGDEELDFESLTFEDTEGDDFEEEGSSSFMIDDEMELSIEFEVEDESTGASSGASDQRLSGLATAFDSMASEPVAELQFLKQKIQELEEKLLAMSAAAEQKQEEVKPPAKTAQVGNCELDESFFLFDEQSETAGASVDEELSASDPSHPDNIDRLGRELEAEILALGELGTDFYSVEEPVEEKLDSKPTPEEPLASGAAALAQSKLDTLLIDGFEVVVDDAEEPSDVSSGDSNFSSISETTKLEEPKADSLLKTPALAKSSEELQLTEELESLISQPTETSSELSDYPEIETVTELSAESSNEAETSSKEETWAPEPFVSETFTPQEEVKIETKASELAVSEDGDLSNLESMEPEAVPVTSEEVSVSPEVAETTVEAEAPVSPIATNTNTNQSPNTGWLRPGEIFSNDATSDTPGSLEAQMRAEVNAGEEHLSQRESISIDPKATILVDDISELLPDFKPEEQTLASQVDPKATIQVDNIEDLLSELNLADEQSGEPAVDPKATILVDNIEDLLAEISPQKKHVQQAIDPKATILVDNLTDLHLSSDDSLHVHEKRRDSSAPDSAETTVDPQATIMVDNLQELLEMADVDRTEFAEKVHEIGLDELADKVLEVRGEESTSSESEDATKALQELTEYYDLSDTFQEEIHKKIATKTIRTEERDLKALNEKFDLSEVDIESWDYSKQEYGTKTDIAGEVQTSGLLPEDFDLDSSVSNQSESELPEDPALTPYFESELFPFEEETGLSMLSESEEPAEPVVSTEEASESGSFQSLSETEIDPKIDPSGHLLSALSALEEFQPKDETPESILEELNSDEDLAWEVVSEADFAEPGVTATPLDEDEGVSLEAAPGAELQSVLADLGMVEETEVADASDNLDDVSETEELLTKEEATGSDSERDEVVASPEDLNTDLSLANNEDEVLAEDVSGVELVPWKVAEQELALEEISSENSNELISQDQFFEEALSLQGAEEYTGAQEVLEAVDLEDETSGSLEVEIEPAESEEPGDTAEMSADTLVERASTEELEARVDTQEEVLETEEVLEVADDSEAVDNTSSDSLEVISGDSQADTEEEPEAGSSELSEVEKLLMGLSPESSETSEDPLVEDETLEAKEEQVEAEFEVSAEQSQEEQAETEVEVTAEESLEELEASPETKIETDQVEIEAVEKESEEDTAKLEASGASEVSELSDVEKLLMGISDEVSSSDDTEEEDLVIIKDDEASSDISAASSEEVDSDTGEGKSIDQLVAAIETGTEVLPQAATSTISEATPEQTVILSNNMPGKELTVEWLDCYGELTEEAEMSFDFAEISVADISGFSKSGETNLLFDSVYQELSGQASFVTAIPVTDGKKVDRKEVKSAFKTFKKDLKKEAVRKKAEEKARLSIDVSSPSAGLRGASIIRRAFAGLFDAGFSLAVGLGFVLFALAPKFMREEILAGEVALSKVYHLVPNLLIAALAFYALNNVYRIIFSKASLGQSLMGLEVTTYEDEEVGFSQAVLRTVCSFLAIPTLGLSLLSGLGKRKLTLHDRYSRTLVKRA